MTVNSQITHVGYSDESNWNHGRIRSLGLVSLPLADLDALQTELTRLLQESKISEFKWKKLGGAKERFAAIKMCNFAIRHALTGRLRIDVLLWDIEDSRHKIRHRDDAANLGRMYYHLFRNVLRVRWPDKAVWQLFPDEHTEIDWRTMKDCLDNVSSNIIVEGSLFSKGLFSVRLKQDFQIEDIQQVDSKKNPMLQFIDMFAGLAVFSYATYDKYEQWLKNQSPQLVLFEDEEGVPAPSHRDQERFPVLVEFDRLCKNSKLGVSLRTKRGLWTPQPKNPINFWFYESQHPEDKAPQKGS